MFRHDITKYLSQDYTKRTLEVGYELEDRVSILGEGNNGIFFSSPPRPDRNWGPPSLLTNGYQGLFA
jgi:hypothetical protein